MKKILALALALIMALSMASVAFAAVGTKVSTAADLATKLSANVVDGEVVLAGDYTGEGYIIDCDVVLNLNGKTMNITTGVGDHGPYLGLQLLKDNDITIKNGTIKASDTNVQFLIQNYSNLTLTDVTLDGTTTGNISYVLSNNNGNTVINGNSSIKAKEGAVAFDVYDFASQGYTGASVTVNTTGTIDGKVEVGGDNTVVGEVQDATLTINNGTFTEEIDAAEDATAGITVNAGTFEDESFLAFTPAAGVQRPGTTVVLSDAFARADYKVKEYDFTTGTKGFQGASYVDEIKINKDNELVLVLKNNYKLAEDKALKGEIVLQDKDSKALITVPVAFTVANKVHETYGETKAKDAIEVPEDDNQVILIDEDGGYVYFTEEMLKGVVKMNKEEKTFLNVIYGVDTKTEDTIDAIEEFLGEDYVDEAIIEYYTFETRAFKNDVDFSYEAYEDDPHFFYLYNDGKLTKIDAKYNDDEEVEAWQWTAVAEGTIIVTDVEIVLAAETTKNPDTGANDVVGMASALAVVSLIAVGAISLKK